MVQSLLDTKGKSAANDAVQAFAASLSCKVLTSGDAGYDAARAVFNGMIDRKPGLIVQPANTADVEKCVKFAKEHGLLVSVKGGGHSAPGYGVCDDGLMIDMSSMQAITVDPKKR